MFCEVHGVDDRPTEVAVGVGVLGRRPLGDPPALLAPPGVAASVPGAQGRGSQTERDQDTLVHGGHGLSGLSCQWRGNPAEEGLYRADFELVDSILASGYSSFYRFFVVL